ncbi:uncharacterized protein K460DRAFT_335308 [Cucurbitaria berberidis CBS 394.84]|uniref:Uncharacterized protein n=1 Tax=Cucurbitaria berberidis CBS 394.84 TaxID=1168544 RepID=A0A9P4L7N9_9PLEO|nr:uncharacterized protein K460DRAFT_335308 [Cucurbitaria berberidis CBS 394.84]KAF1844522.1 hypothetical protein K460DRAFT_335308 [Cucurbitaria berberidis CBS 394.84]
MPAQLNHIQEFDEDELIDDSTSTIPISGLSTPLGLRDRFIRRLARLSGASVQISDERECSMSIFLTRRSSGLELDKELCRLLERGSTLDHDLGDRLIALYHSVHEYTGSMKKLNALIHSASTMTRSLPHLHVRMKPLLGKARFADELYQLICTLGFPERVYSTLVRAARTSRTFERLPSVHYFFTKPPQKRESVFRLIQFLNDRENTEPRPCLQRDYGFSFCKQREEVSCVKDIYSRLLQKVQPSDLHTACMSGELYELGYKNKVFIDAKNSRLMKNDYGNPYLGFDNVEGLEKFKDSLFKRRLRS